ncbi:MAG: GNAT family N-acetyltransferase [Anaerolineaceae bacterium]|nr:GNAT family N-acetyltransferase [Anaerolineaceae bacterium]
MMTNPFRLSSISCQVSLAQISNHDQINAFLKEDNLCHRHLDWVKPLEWLPESKAFYLARIDNSLSGILSCADEIPGIYWIRLFVASRSFSYSQILKNLLPSVICNLQGKSVKCLYSLAFEDWYKKLLVDTGFTSHSSVVVLKYSGSNTQSLNLNSDISIRPMEEKDIKSITSIDNCSFEPIWQNSQKILSRAFQMADLSTVAIHNNVLIGYQMSTKTHNSSHLARLAVLPAYQNRHIGKTLAKHMIDYFQNQGINNITVNTQSDNASSLHIYKKLGFSPTGESFPVFNLPL